MMQLHLTMSDLILEKKKNIKISVILGKSEYIFLAKTLPFERETPLSQYKMPPYFYKNVLGWLSDIPRCSLGALHKTSSLNLSLNAYVKGK